MSKKMGSLEFTKCILLFSVIHQILSDRAIFACTMDDDEPSVPTEYRMKRSHAYEKKAEKIDEVTRANMQAAAKNQTPRTRRMNLCIGEPTKRPAAVPVVQPKETQTSIQPKNVATIIPTKDGVTGTIVHPKVSNTATMVQQKPIKTASVIQPRIVTVKQPQNIPSISVVQPTCISTDSVNQPNAFSSSSASVIQPKATATATLIQSKPGSLCEKPLQVMNCSLTHQENNKHEIYHVNDSLKNEHHYVVEVPADHHLNNTNTIHHVNHTHYVKGKNLKLHENGAFYEETSNGAKIFHTASQDTSRNSERATVPRNSTIVAVIQNYTDHNVIFPINDKPVILEIATPEPNVTQQSVKTLSDVLKQVNGHLLSTPKPLTSGNIGGINVVENRMEENNLDQIKLEPDDDIVIDKFDVEEVKESYKNPADYTNDVSAASSDRCIYPSIDYQGMQSMNGAVLSYDDYVNYYNNGGYNNNLREAFNYGSGDNKDNSRGTYNYYFNNSVTPAPKTNRLMKSERSDIKDRVWRKWINTQIYIKRPAHENALQKVDEHVKSTSWSHEQKIPVIGYNGYYTNQNSSSCS